MKRKNKAKSLSEKRRLNPSFGMWKTAPYGAPVDHKKWPKKK